MKKQHLDINAKRDFSVLSKKDKNGIEYWLISDAPGEYCPFSVSWLCNGKDKRCLALFPEIKVHKEPIDKHYERMCPCSILYIKDVIEIAKKAIK